MIEIKDGEIDKVKTENSRLSNLIEDQISEITE